MAYRWLFYEWTNKVMNTESVKRFVEKCNSERKFYMRKKCTDKYKKYTKGL